MGWTIASRRMWPNLRIKDSTPRALFPKDSVPNARGSIRIRLEVVGLALCVGIGIVWVIAGEGILMQFLGILFTLSIIGSLTGHLRS